MKKRTALSGIGLGLFALVALISVTGVQAHHLDDPLSYLSHLAGAAVVSEVDLVVGGPAHGVVPTKLSDSDVTAGLDVSPGDLFQVSAGSITETVVFEASDFADVDQPTAAEVVAAINAQLTVAEVRLDHGYLVLSGHEGGVGSLIQVQNLGGGDTVQRLRFGTGAVAGTHNLHLVVSTPSNTSFEGYPYFVLASATPGVTGHLGFDVPITLDVVTDAFIQGATLGYLPGFFGTLDEEGDASAILPTSLLPDGAMPEALYLAYVVVDPADGQPVFVSNRFTINVHD